MTGKFVRTAASKWFARQASGEWSPRDGEKFAAWLASDAENQVAWREMQATWNSLGDARDVDEMAVLRQQAFQRGPPYGSRRQLWGLGFAATVLLALGALLWHSMALETPAVIGATDAQSEAADVPALPRFATRIGARATHVLSDGSRLELNTDTAIRVLEWSGSRTLVLERGEAYFTVAEDPSRPFVVSVDALSVTAIGTQFAVRRDGSRATVTLTEGRVRLARTSGDVQAGTELVPGYQAVADERLDWKVQRVDIVKATSWRTGRLIFDNEPLGHVVAEMNRYSTIRLRLLDASLAAQPLSGVFRAGDAQGLAHTLESYGVVRIASTNEQGISLAAPQ